LSNGQDGSRCNLAVMLAIVANSVDALWPASSRARHGLSFLGRLSRGSELPGHPPGQQLVNPIDGMVGDAPEHMVQVSLRINAAELARADQAVD
jgi:hypothetical protein